VIAAMRAAPAPSTAHQLRIVRPEDHPKVYRSRLSFPRQAALAAAAALALVAGVLFFTPLGHTWLRSPSNPTALAGGFLTRVVNFTYSQHTGCGDFGRLFDRKMTARTEAKALEAAIELLPRIPSVLEFRSADLAKQGYTFAGLGPCAVPGWGRSAHLIYKPDPTIAPNAPVVSLFVQEDKGHLLIDANVALTNRPTDAAALASCERCLTVWRKDGLIYYLVAPPLPVETRRAFDEPAQERSIL
jgi:hypothetical protein